MIHNTYITAVFITSALGWASWFVVVYKLSPFSQPTLGLSLFYSSLFIALAGTFALLFYFLRVWTNKKEIYNVHLNTSLRQGTLLSIMVIIGLAFQRLRVLTWWDGILLLAIVLLIEFYFSSQD
ncbi:hypothetical protein KJ657_03690 [Patescibacteria group bacterium]|nr:hypothetical protein [Patescibacteria group bacterium]MBU1016166.1 hypothetical protein [Patescibacteria group bacterium]MBU1684714.1 hypothetical protein [Patescibacteria group bacterium]MBU1938899.1 hypothetical protein [Patescibacteria group bacterium]